MNRIRVLIVDGSSTTRRTLRRLLDRDPDLEIVGVSATGHPTLARMHDLSPDLVLLDISMPDMEGLKTLAVLQQTYPALPVIVFSQLTKRGSQTTLDALRLGASDYLTKPASTSELERCVQGELTKKIKSLGAKRQASPSATQIPKPAGATSAMRAPCIPPELLNDPFSAESLPPGHISPSRQTVHKTEIVAIAASTGGPNALATLLSSLPPSFSTPIIVVQHMASGFTSTLAESLRRQTRRSVREVDTAQPLHSASVWIASGGRHLVVNRSGATVQVAPNDDPPENGCCPSADVMLRSVVDVFGSRCLVVVLTGMGYDGLAGCRAIRQAGGMILVQDEASSVAWGMPGQVATAGLADEVLPLTELSQEICRRITGPRVRRLGP